MEKNCANHPQRPAVEACRVCERSLCNACTATLNSRIFCSSECMAVYKEVTHWIDRKAEAHEWNLLAEPPDPAQATPTGAETGVGGTAEETLPTTPSPPAEEPSIVIRVKPEEPATETPLGCVLHPESPAIGTCTQCAKPFCSVCAVDTSWGKFCSVECSIAYPPAGLPPMAPPARKLSPILLLASLAAVVLAGVVITVSLLSKESERKKPVQKHPAVAASRAEQPRATTPPEKPQAYKPDLPQTSSKHESPRVAEPPPKPAEPKSDRPTVWTPLPAPPKPAQPKVLPPVPGPEAPSTPRAKPVGAKPEPPQERPAIPPPTPAPSSSANAAEETPPRPVAPPAELHRAVSVRPEVPARDAVNLSLDQAARLIRDVAPCFSEIAQALDQDVTDQGSLRKLLGEVDHVRTNLRAARRLYSDVCASCPNPALIEARLKKIESLLETMAGCAEQIKSRL